MISINNIKLADMKITIIAKNADRDSRPNGGRRRKADDRINMM